MIDPGKPLQCATLIGRNPLTLSLISCFFHVRQQLHIVLIDQAVDFSRPYVKPLTARTFLQIGVKIRVKYQRNDLGLG